MAKKQDTKQYGLKGGHPNTFRRTVNIGTDKNPQKVQLFFEPGVPQSLTAKEIEGLKAEIDEGFIVPWESHGHGMRPVPTNQPTTDAALLAENESLREQVTSLSAQVAELTSQVEALTDPGDASELDEEENADAPLGDE